MTSERIGFDYVIYHDKNTGAEATVREAVDTLCQSSFDDAPMSEKELKFIDDVSKWPHYYTMTEKQADWIYKIYLNRYIEKKVPRGTKPPQDC